MSISRIAANGNAALSKLARLTPRQELARARPHDREHRVGRGHVGERRARVLGDVAPDPVGVARRLRRAGDDQEPVGASRATVTSLS